MSSNNQTVAPNLFVIQRLHQRHISAQTVNGKLHLCVPSDNRVTYCCIRSDVCICRPVKTSNGLGTPTKHCSRNEKWDLLELQESFTPRVLYKNCNSVILKDGDVKRIFYFNIKKCMCWMKKICQSLKPKLYEYVNKRTHECPRYRRKSSVLNKRKTKRLQNKYL